MNTDIEYDRGKAALVGLALGDALGMPTQSLSPEMIEGEYGQITTLVDASAMQPVAPLMSAGHVTDDTEQALLLADLLIESDGDVPVRRFATALLEWEDAMKARGSLDLLGPSTKTALEAVRGGADVTTTGKTGTTNGAAMRVTPIGIAFPTRDLHRFAQGVYASCRVTHDTRQGFTAAALVASAVSLGIEGASTREALSTALDLVPCYGTFGVWAPQASVTARLEEALTLASSNSDDDSFLEAVKNQIGTSVESNESIPCALALAYRYWDRPASGLLAAANLGGDTDTIGAIAGAVLGATTGMSAWPAQWWQKVRTVCAINLDQRVAGLLHLRSRRAQEGTAR